MSINILPIQITFRSMQASPTIEYLVNKHYAKIKHLHPKISTCRAAVSLIHRQKTKAKIFSINLELSVPQRKLVCRKVNQNIYLAIKEAFQALDKSLGRQLKKKAPHIDRRALYRQSEVETDHAAVNGA